MNRFKLHDRIWTAAFLLIALQLPANAVTSDSDFDVPDAALHAHPYLGIGEYFGRWENGIVPIAYNHAGARTGVSAEEMISKIETAFEIIEGVADIKFEFSGETSRESLDLSDGLVVMGWEHVEDSFAARAGPGGLYDPAVETRIGYYPYSDGRVAFNSAASSSFTVALIIHELLHLLGFGHSENPESIMTPSGFLFSTLQQDDIAALQAVYGPPDEFISPREVVTLKDGPLNGVRVVTANTGFYTSPPSSSDNADLKPVAVLDTSHSPDDWVIFRISYSAMVAGTKITDYVTLPSGNQVAGTPFAVSYSSGAVHFFIGYVGEMLAFPGVWQTDIAVAGTSVAQARVFVNSTAGNFNRTPSASLRVEHDDEFFRMHLNVADPEGDSLVTDWMLPGAGTIYNASDAPVLSRGAIGIGAAQVFGQVRDTVDRNPPDVRAGSAYGPGFGTLVSRWIANPAEPNTPTFFTDSGILHIPSLDLEGSLITANFKLTGLDGIVLKFLEFDPLLSFSGTATAKYRDDTGMLTLAKLIVYDQGQKFQFNNAVFRIVPGSSPLKLELTSVNQ